MPTLEMYLTAAAYAIVLALLLTFTAAPLLGILQQEGYSGRAMLRWVYKKGNMLKRRYSLLFLSALLLTALFSLVFCFAGTEAAVLLAFFAYGLLLLTFLFAFRFALKVPLKRTGRALRLAVFLFLMLFALLFGAQIGLLFAAEEVSSLPLKAFLRAAPLSFAPLLLPTLLFLVNCLLKIYEVPRLRCFVKREGKVLAASPCIKVGITGSFGKTSVKHFARQILEAQFRVIATPASFNTPAGVARCIKEQGVDCEIFLAEMGARHTGDIGELCDMVRPTFGAITGITGQHLETFGTVEAVRKEKGVLAERAETVVLGASAESLDRAGALLEGRDFGAENIVCTPDGTQFDLVLGEKRFPVKTRLLGRHAAEDLALAAALSFALGMPAEKVASRLPLVEPMPHRLTLLKGNGVNILDDSYNSNTEGAAEAVRILRLFGGAKYVVTPGLVELGELEEKKNAALGESFVGLDGVILVGETRALPIRKGYLDGGGEEGKLTIVPTLSAAEKLLGETLREGDCVLFLNDLPDKYL